MAQLTLSGVTLGLRSKSYDFEDRDTGKRNSGVSHRLFLWDSDNNEPIEVTVPQDQLGLVGSLAEGELTTLAVEARANQGRVSLRLLSVVSEPVKAARAATS